MFFFLLFSGLLCVALAQFPTVCVDTGSLMLSECCPIPEGFYSQCGGSGRGECGPAKASDEGDYQPHVTFLQTDDRAHWPIRFFNRTCDCEWPFSGYDCSECAYGYYGTECSTQKVIKRWNILAPERKDDLEKFKTYLTWSYNNESDYSVMVSDFQSMFTESGELIPKFTTITHYYFHIWIHHYAVKFFVNGTFVYDIHDYSHLGPAFVTWHRIYLLNFERMLQKIANDYEFSLPYWNWIDLRSCDICTDEYMGAVDSNGTLSTDQYFKDWVGICRYLPEEICDPNVNIDGKIWRVAEPKDEGLPVYSEVGLMMNLPHFDTPPYNTYSNCSFRNMLGGNINGSSGLETVDLPIRFMHGAIHIWINGTMIDVPSSGSDPIFYPHHVFVDRLFEIWYRTRNATMDQYPSFGAPFGHNRMSNAVPFFPTVRHYDVFRKSTELGYTFDDMDDSGVTVDADAIFTTFMGACTGEGNGYEYFFE